MQDKNEKKVTEIYHNIISKANFPYSRAEFGEMMQDKDNAKYFYNTYKSAYGDNLLGAPDEDSFLDSLGMRSKADLLNEATPDIMQRNATPAMDSTPMQANKSVATDMAPVEVPSMELPTAEDNLNTLKERGNELVQNNTATPKDSVLPQGGARILDAAPQKSAEQVISEYTPVERVVEEGHIIGEDKITDALMADNLIAQTDERLAQWHKENDEFIAEYEKRMSSTDSNAHNLYSESFSPMQIFANRKSREDKEFINANSAKYNELIRQRDAIQRTKETVETMKQYTDFDRSVAIGEEMSSMVDKGELADFDMKTLREISDDKERLDALTDMYNQGRISEDTFNKILDLGDTSDKSGLWYGMFKTGKIEDFATLGLNELARSIDIADIAKRYNEGLPVNEDELTLLNVYNKLAQVQSQDRSFGFNAGMGMQQSLQFVLESLATGGVNAIGSAAKQGGKALLKRLGQNAVRQAILTPVTPMMYNDYAQRVTNLYLSEDETTGDNMDVTIGDKLGALYKSYVGTFAERFSETLGNVVGEAKLFGRLVNNKGTRKLLGKAFDTMAKIADNPAYKATADLLAAGGITDIPGEFASEYSGNIINSIFTLDAEPLAELFDTEFFGQVALQSVMMGGMGNAVSFTVGSGAAALERRKTNKAFKQGIENLSNTSFDNPALESLKGELVTALNGGKLTGEDGTLETGDVTNILSQMKAEIARDGNVNDRNAMRAVDNAVRIGTYKYGQDAAVMAIVQDKIGEYLHDDGNVYEVVDNQGNGYFILAESGDAVVVINRTTNEKKSIRKDFFQEGSIKQTKGSDWAMEQFLMNIDTWNLEDAEIQPLQGEQFTPADKLDIGGVMFDVAGYNEQTGKYTVIDEKGVQTEIDPNDEDVTPIYSQPVDQTETEQQVVNTAQEEDLSDSTEDNTTIVPEVQSDEKNALNEPNLADSTLEEENAESIENEIEYDENGDPVWSKIPPERGKQEIDSAFGEDEAKAFVADKIKAAEKAVKSAEKKKPKAGNIRDRKAEIEQIKAEREQAKANLDYWNAMSQLYNAQPIEETPVEQTEQVLKNTSDSVLPEGVTPYTVGENIKQRYNDAPKAYGAEDTYTDAEGNTYKGRWVVTEADAVTPSHNAETLQPNEGFPLTDKGRNVNDNDYSTKRGVVETMAANYDARALDEPVIVSEGAIVSGNNRTISGQIAAQNGTDTKYKEALPIKAAMRGVSAEELGKFKNPRLVFELAEPIEYTTETFAKFNRPRSKTKSPVDMAIAIGKQDTSRLVGQVLDTIGEVEKFSDLYQNQAKVAAIMKQVVESGIINQNEMPQFYTEEYGITDAGKDFIETLLIGSVINEDQIRILNSEGMKQYREKIASAMIPIAKNMTYEDNFGKELNTAIKYLKEARDAKTNIEGILLDNPMFDKKDYNRLAIFTALMLQRKLTEFRQFVNNLNERAELGGENLFGEQENAQSVLDDYKQQNKLSDYEQRTINLAEGGRQTDVQGVPTGVQGDGTDTDTAGESGDGNVISEGQKQSVDNGNNEQNGVHVLGISDQQSAKRRPDVSEESRGDESQQSTNGSTNNRGADKTGNAEVSEAIRNNEEERQDLSESSETEFSIRTNPAPRKTGVGYKVFVLKDGKLYPPMVANPNGEATPVNVWLDADAAPISGQSKTGRNQVKAGGKGTQGGSGSLAYRPGWHLGEIPYALQFNRKNPNTGERELFPANFVWAEVEYADDVNYQEEAMAQGVNQNGKFQHSLAGLQRVPENGSYRYRTNPNPETDPWIITGAMKVNRILTPSEVDAIVAGAGREPQPRQEGAITDAQVEQLNKDLGLNVSDNAKQLATDAVLSALNKSGIEVIEATDKQAKEVLQSTSGVEAQIVYHGSAAKFDKFDHSYMGTGEGAQAYGWGSYVTEVEGIGRSYAKTAAKKGDKVLMNGEDVTHWAPRTPALSLSPTQYVASCVMKYKDAARDFMQSRLDALYDGLKSEDLSENKRNLVEQAIQLVEGAIGVYDNNKWEYIESTPQLYTVEIPDDNGKNYLPWEGNFSKERLSEILDSIYDVVKDDELFDWESFSSSIEDIDEEYGDVDGEDIYNNVMRFGSTFLDGAQKKASEILSKAGFTGVSVPAQFRTGGRADGAKNYVIFNENDLQIKERIEFMKTPNGTIYGWTVGGKIYLTKDGFNPDTPIHEYTHIWANAMRQKNPKGWASIKNLLKDTPIWNEVVNDENYSNIRDNEDSVASEVLSRISGSKNAERMEKEAQRMIDEAKGSIGKARAQELIKRVKEALNKFWNWIGTELFKIEKFDSIEQVADRVLYDLLNKTDLSSAAPSQSREMSIGGRPAGYSTNNMEMTDKDRLLYAIQDRMRPVKKVMDEIINCGGNIKDNSDPYSQEFLATSRASAEIEDFKNEKYEPLAKAIADAMKVFVEDMGMTAEDARKAVDDYLYARHAPERNKRICTNEIFEEGMKDIPMDKRHLVDDAFEAELKRMAGLLYDNQFKGGKNIISPAGLSAEQSKVAMAAVGAMQKKATAISKETAKDEQTGKVVVTANNRSGMSDAEAEFIMQKYYTPQTQTALDEVSSKVKDCTDFTLDKWLEYGLISNDDYNAYKNQYEYYIPLRGWEDTEDIDYTELPSKAFNVASEIVSGNRKAEGRTSKAKDPLAYIASLAQSACISGNRNLIRQKAFNMVAQNEGLISDLAVIENTYEIYDDSGNIIGYSKVTPSKALFDQGRVKIIRDKDYRWHKTPQQLKAHQVGVMIDGVRHVVTFKGSLGTLAATAINGTHNDTRNAVIQGIAKATRFVSSNLTAKNVYFLGKNLMRDLGFGNFAYFVENGAGKTLKLNRYFLSAMKTAAMDAMGADKSTYSDAALYDEFKKNGGQTGYVQLESIDKLSKQMNRLIEDAAKNRGRISQEAVNAKDLLFETFDVLGKASENAMRFAIYKLEREAGSTARQSAIRAKEITVNFNRQGTKTKGFSAIYAFFNPAVQGTYRFAKLAKANPKRFVTAMASLMAIKFGLGLICEMFSGNGDEPEGERPYDRLSDYVKATNWVVPLSFLPGDENNDKFLLIPMPQSVRGPVHISDLALDVMYGKKDFGEAVKDYAMFNIGEFIPFDIDAVDLANDNPVGTMLQAAMPTVLRPWIEEALNRDFMGNPIYKEPFTKNQDYLPQHQMAFKSTSPLLVGASRFLNEVAGGSEYRSAGKTSENGQAGESWIGSFMDVNPASAEHILSGYFGGMFKPVLDVWDTMTSVAEKDVETDISSIAIVNQFIKGPSSKPGYKRFYQMRDEVELINNLRAANKKEGISNDIIDSNKYNQQILALYKEASEMINEANEAISMIEDKERISEIEEARDAIILQAASMYREICDNRDKENKEQ